MDETGVVLEELRRKVDRQEQIVDQFRSRGAQLIGYSTVVAGLFAVVSSRSQELRSNFALGAVGAFVAVIICVIGLEFPRKFEFGVNVAEGVKALEEGRQFTPRSVELEYVKGYQLAFKNNVGPSKDLLNWYRLGLVAFAAQVVLWALAFL